MCHMSMTLLYVHSARAVHQRCTGAYVSSSKMPSFPHYDLLCAPMLPMSTGSCVLLCTEKAPVGYPG